MPAGHAVPARENSNLRLPTQLQFWVNHHHPEVAVCTLHRVPYTVPPAASLRSRAFSYRSCSRARVERSGRPPAAPAMPSPTLRAPQTTPGPVRFQPFPLVVPTAAHACHEKCSWVSVGVGMHLSGVATPRLPARPPAAAAAFLPPSPRGRATHLPTLGGSSVLVAGLPWKMSMSGRSTESSDPGLSKSG